MFQKFVYVISCWSIKYGGPVSWYDRVHFSYEHKGVVAISVLPVHVAQYGQGRNRLDS
jgi:hypothetical protein